MGATVDSLTDKPLPVEFDPPLLDADYTGIALLMTDLQVALTYLDCKEGRRDTASFQAILRHARRTYDELLGVLPHLSISDDNRRHLDLQLPVLQMRLMRFGEEFPSSIAESVMVPPHA